MTTSTSLLADSTSPDKTLREAMAMIATAEGELVLDFSPVLHIEPKALRALEELAEAAERAQRPVVVRGVNVKVYKVLKLARLTSQFTFVS
jgi:anti-anti-sigma regulatory factor